VVCLGPRDPVDIAGPRPLSGVVVRPLNFTVRSRVDVALAPAFALIGFFAGSLFSSQLTRWGALLWVSTTKHGGDFLGPPKRRLLWALPFVALLHSAPYLIALIIVLTVYALQGKVGSPWLWFLGGFYAYLVLVSLTLLKAYRKHRMGKASAGPNHR
jgi:hypothetical protein